jgi:hypothetical protein
VTDSAHIKPATPQLKCDIKLLRISFLENDLASTPIERASSMYGKIYSYTSVPSLLMADLIQKSGSAGQDVDLR